MMIDAPAASLAHGAEVIEAVLKTLPGSPGVYRMLDAKGDALYVGKAKNLKKRVVAYTRTDQLPLRLQRMVAFTRTMEIVTTHTEAEALLLESNLIKKLKPRYNILLRDDKSFPFIRISREGEWPRITKHRGARSDGADYFGPFASAAAVNQALVILQKAFLLRNCSDAMLKSRTRPCLMHQIKRCSAPCVGRIARADYARLVGQARAFLTGDSHDLQKDFARAMSAAAERQDYEEAAAWRDRIRALSQIQAHQDIDLGQDRDLDIVAARREGGLTAIQVLFFRAGRHTGNRAYFPSQTADAEAAEVLSAFLGQFYATHPPPPLILAAPAPADAALLAEAFSLRAGHKVTLAHPQRGPKRALLRTAETNARDALSRKLAETATQARLLEGVAELFGLPAPPARIEVYDNSHIQGTNAVGAMVVAGPEGFEKAAYRTWTIREATPGDDFGMMREVFRRRFARALAEDPERARWPDLVLIDGGAGQLSAAAEILAGIGADGVPLVAIAKGPDRNAGREWFHCAGRAPAQLPPNDPVLFYLQRLRDEAHRFAIGSHRAKRARALTASPLDAVPGIGAARKKALLHHFGSARGVAEAGVEDLAAVEGVSRALAERLYAHFHDEG
ncbi:excinuclease ABC subunit UvrC [Oleispirillum naphthae]|uniref:excinuclease ABC subunit UvrC n=1 Tax=Oleispirillum naphthae TaxID=2838853 RepID=UPI0030822D3A